MNPFMKYAAVLKVLFGVSFKPSPKMQCHKGMILKDVEVLLRNGYRYLDNGSLPILRRPIIYSVLSYHLQYASINITQIFSEIPGCPFTNMVYL